MMTQETLLRLQLLRAKGREGTLTQEECREAIALLRADRGATAQATAGSKVSRARKTAAAKPNGDDLLSELENL